MLKKEKLVRDNASRGAQTIRTGSP